MSKVQSSLLRSIGVLLGVGLVFWRRKDAISQDEGERGKIETATVEGESSAGEGGDVPEEAPAIPSTPEIDDTAPIFQRVDKEIYYYRLDGRIGQCDKPLATFHKETDTYLEYAFLPELDQLRELILDIGEYTLEYTAIATGRYDTVQASVALRNGEGKVSNAKEISVKCGEIGGYMIRVYKDSENMVMRPLYGGHDEAGSNTVFVASAMKLYDVYEDILEPQLGLGAHFQLAVEATATGLVLTESSKGSDSVFNENGNEKITVSLPDMQIIAREPLAGEARYDNVMSIRYEPLYRPQGTFTDSGDLQMEFDTANKRISSVTADGIVYSVLGNPGNDRVYAIVTDPSFSVTDIGFSGVVYKAFSGFRDSVTFFEIYRNDEIIK